MADRTLLPPAAGDTIGVAPLHPTTANRRFSHSPRLRLLLGCYHQSGLKHLVLLVVLIGYSVLGATIFYTIEQPNELERIGLWRSQIERNRTQLVEQILLPQIFNESEMLLIVEDWKVERVEAYEHRIGVRYSHHLQWDFSNAMLYAWTILTTIGYGHLYPHTDAGRVATMIYALVGIPLALAILNDLGKLLTRLMKFPWFLAKRGSRRLFQYCTRATREQIAEADLQDKAKLDVFDLPIPIAIVIVVGWIFICSATFCIWETEWDYLVAFYFFFISLSTIGLGDIIPREPQYLLFCFGYIIVGLSLVSMCINLIQARLETTYKSADSATPAAQLPRLNGSVSQSHRHLRHSASTSIFSFSTEAAELLPDSPASVPPRRRDSRRRADPRGQQPVELAPEEMITIETSEDSPRANQSGRQKWVVERGESLKRELSQYENAPMTVDQVMAQIRHEENLS